MSTSLSSLRHPIHRLRVGVGVVAAAPSLRWPARERSAGPLELREGGKADLPSFTEINLTG
jgi:hypothetical protein